MDFLRPWFRVCLIVMSCALATLHGQGAGASDSTPAEVVLHRWSGDLNVPDPVACTVDPQGRIYVTSTTRRKVADLDIREHTMWIPDDVGMTSIEQKRAFYHEALAPGKLLRPRGSLADHNGDGSIDWRDLTVHTERIYQLRDEDGDGTADRITVFAEGFNTEVTGIAAGVLWHDGWLYATIAPDLWRLKDTDDDGVADIREIVVSGFGMHIAYGGHDMHGLSVGPDGRIYWSIGDKGANVTTREGRHYDYPNEGAVFRIEPDGSNFEVYAHGLRNPQEPAFDTWGDWFVVDNDADMEGERERFVHIVEGSDSGWRCNYQYMGLEAPWMREGLWKTIFPGQAAYLLPPRANYSDGPAGFRFEPGTALGPRQREHFILTEFPSGRMRAFQVQPEGATFTMVKERDLSKGVMGIGLSWHPDGSLAMVDWIGGYPLDGLGAIWRVDSVERDDAARRETLSYLQTGFDAHAEETLLELLAHRDQRVRLGAQFELVRRHRAPALLNLAKDVEAARLPRVHAVWGYGQLLRQRRVEAETLGALLADSDAELRAQVAKILGDGPATTALAALLISRLEDTSPRVRLQAALALGKWRVRDAVPALLALAERDGADPVLRHAAASGLAGCATAEELAAQASQASLERRLCSVVALRRQRAPQVQVYLSDHDTRVVAEAARAIHDDQSIAAALPALAALLSGELQAEPVLRRAVNANFRLGDAAAAVRLLDFALEPAADREFQREALTLLRLWPQPPRLDRVDGWARKVTTAPVQQVLTPRIDELLALPDAELKSLAVEIMLAHRLEATAPQIVRILDTADAPGELRAQALRWLIQRHVGDPLFEPELRDALAEKADEPVYAVAMAFVQEQRPEAFPALARAGLQTRSVTMRQQLLQMVAELGTAAGDDVLLEAATAWRAGRLEPALHLDLLEALAARAGANPTLASVLREYNAGPNSAAKRELLTGGDISKGRDIALNHLAANCLACHMIEANTGSQVGPSLRTVSRRLDPAGLLRALVEPGAEFAPGYGLVSITLTNGENVSGGLLREAADHVAVRTLTGEEQTVARAQIAEMTPPVSMMPPMDAILSPRELRDLVAYLGTLGAPAAPAGHRGSSP